MSFSRHGIQNDWKDTISRVSPGSRQMLVRRGGITNHHLIAYSVSNISAKKLPKSVDVRWSYSEKHQCHSFETQCIISTGQLTLMRYRCTQLALDSWPWWDTVHGWAVSMLCVLVTFRPTEQASWASPNSCEDVLVCSSSSGQYNQSINQSINRFIAQLPSQSIDFLINYSANQSQQTDTVWYESKTLTVQNIK